MKNLFNLYDRSKHINFITEILSGLTVSLALVPEAIAFALIAGFLRSLVSTPHLVLVLLRRFLVVGQA